ncbi:MAG: PAS domain S-box protein [Holophagaceae bacterium]|nr:PAS domain S-box protein [Holophagaceae bacterium]
MQAAPKPEKVAIQLKWKHQFQFAGYYAAQRMGYFTAEGLDVHLVEGGPHRDPVREVTAGKAAYGIGDSDLLVARAQGLPVVVVAAIFQHSPYVLMTRAADGLIEPKDLVGKRVMVEFNQGDIQTRAMFMHEGIDPSSITFLPQSWNFRDLQEGRTDAMSGYYGVEPYQLEQAGIPVKLIRPAEHGIDFYGDCLFTTTEEARDHPERVEAVRRAVAKGWNYALQHPEEVSGWILAMPGAKERGLRPGNMVAEAQAMKILILPDIVPVGSINKERWDRTLAIYKQLGILPATMRLDGFLFDPDRLRSARTKDRLILTAMIVAGVILVFLAWIYLLRRRVERSTAALTESEDRYRQLVQTAPEAIFIEFEGRFDYLNPAAVELFGLHSAEELIGHSVLENVHEDDKPRIQERVQGFQEHPEALRRTGLRLHRPNGKVVEVEAMTSPIPWKGGVGGRVFLRDITERNAAWQAMAESEENYRQLVENSPDCIFVANGGVFRYVNPAGLKLFEVESDEEVLGKSVLDFLHPKDRIMMEERGWRFLETGAMMPAQELRVVGHGGRVTPVEVTITRVRFQGEVAARVFMRDISEWKHAEAALKNSQGILRGFFDGAPFQMGVTEFTEDQDVVLVSVNTAAADSMGIGVKDAPGLRIGDLGFTGPYRGVWVEEYRRALETREPVHFERELSLAGLNLRWAITLAYIGPGPHGRPRFAYLVEDVTERHRLARDLEEREATLRAFYDGAPMMMGVSEVTPEGEMLAVSINEAMARSFGRPASEIAGATARQVGMRPGDHDTWLKHYREAEAAGHPIHFVLAGQMRDRKRSLSVTIAPLGTTAGGNPRFCFISEDITELVRDQEALRVSESRLEEAQRLAHLGSWNWDLATQVLVWSDELCRIYGVDPDSHKPSFEDFLQRVHPEDRAEIERLVEQAKVDLKPFSHESRIVRPDGAVRVIFDYAEVLVDEKGLLKGIGGACMDLTERKQAEKTQEALHSISEAAHSAATLPDLFRRIHEIIGGLLPAPNFFVALYDERKDELTFPYFVDEQDPPPGIRKLDDGTLTGQVIRTGKALLLTRETREDGTGLLLPVVGSDSMEWVGVPLKSRSRTLGALVLQSYSGDIAYTSRDKALLEFVSGQVAVAIERKQAEQELRDQNDLYLMVQRATSDVIWVRDIATDTLAWSDTITATFGYPIAEVPATRQWWIDRIHPEDRERALDGIRATIEEGGTVWSDEYRFRHMDGHYTQVLDRGCVVKDADGRITRMVGAMADLSLRIRAEEAQAANQAKSEFLATMTHELRTPMIGMLGMVEILSHTKLDPDQRSALGTIQSSARALLGIIGDILDFSKIEAGKLELEPVAVSLRRIVEEEFASYSGAAAGKGLQVACEIDPGIAEAHVADPVRFREILDNFFSNALKFTHQGKVGIRAELLGSDAEAQTLAFRVWDTGIGVSPENQKRLFQPFVQAESTTTRRFGGTGLGLSISLRLAQMMGGRITMDSEEGKGTTMSFIAAFPLADPADLGNAAQAAVWEPVEPPGREAALAAGCLILLAEDHATNRMVLTRQLQLAGYQVDAVEDGLAALEALGQTKYGLLLTDIQMPHMDGYQVAAEVRRIETETGNPRIPILALTANALHGELERCQAVGMDDCIIKPVSIPGLDAKLRQWLPGAAGLMAPRPVDPDAEPLQAAMEAPGAPPVDFAVLEGLSQGDRAATLEILRDFRDTCRIDLAGLRLAVDRGDLAEAARGAHRIKGASRMVGAGPLAEAAALLESRAGAGEGHLVAGALRIVEAAFAVLENLVTRESAQG